MNRTILCGRLTREPDIRYSQNEKQTCIARFNLAVNRQYKRDESDFISCVAFGKTAEFIGQYIIKGTKILVEGRIQTGSYTDQQGLKHYTTDVVVEQVEFAESKKTENPANGFQSAEGENVPFPQGNLPY